MSNSPDKRKRIPLTTLEEFHDMADALKQTEGKISTIGLHLLEHSMEEVSRAHDEGTVTDDDLDSAIARFLDVRASVLADGGSGDNDLVDSLQRLRRFFPSPISDPFL